MAQADIYLDQVYQTLGLNGATDTVKYQNVTHIVNELQIIHAANPINGKTTGTISERLCELGLKASVPNIYKKIGSDWNWMADFSVLGHPFNLLVSVKSFKAKERLIVSGSGNNLSPTIGWGLFDDIDEWSLNRVQSYLYRSFICIYMPALTYNTLPINVRNVNNINGNRFLRVLDDFCNDLAGAVINNTVEITRI